MRSLVALLILSFSAQAEVVTTSIYDIFAPQAGEDTYLALATNRMVYEVPVSKSALVKKLYQAKASRALVRINLADSAFASNVLDSRETIIDLELKSIAVRAETADFFFNTKDASGVVTPMDNYSPSVLSSMDQANRYFSTMRTDTRGRSQCYNRAHVWSWELYRRFGHQGKKVWIFFTRKYIRAYKWKWWFHVSPSTEVAGQKEEILLDRKFTRSALTFTDWKNEFIKNKATCPEIFKYTDYSQNQESQYCYYMRSSMYYWQPFQIEDLEKGQAPRHGWVESELNRAYKNGISIWHRGVDL